MLSSSVAAASGPLEHAKETVHAYLRSLQRELCETFESLEAAAHAYEAYPQSSSLPCGPARFRSDAWERAEGGGGVSCVLEGGAVFEKAGVNLSRVQGPSLPASATAQRPECAGHPFEAMGVSVVMHPRNPYAPTTHMNVRCFVVQRPDAAVWWFGGGMDLTPYYGFAEDAVEWHRACKSTCEHLPPIDGTCAYQRLKADCDRYFYLKHRGEARGIGGTFFDDFQLGGFEPCFELMRRTGKAFAEAYSRIVKQRWATPYTERERAFQAYRRGRYVEFNLLYDRGTLFGLQSGGRAESILMSLPPAVVFRYDWRPEPGSPEARLYDEFLPPRDWLAQETPA